MQSSRWAFRVNAGMVASAVLLVAGGGQFLAAEPEAELQRTLGLGLVIAASAIYMGARIVMIVRERRR